MPDTDIEDTELAPLDQPENAADTAAENEETAIADDVTAVAEDLEDLKSKNAKLFARTKTAETEAKELKQKLKTFEQTKDTKATVDLSSLKDQYALLQAQVPADDIEEVLSYAKYKAISVAEALKTTAVKAILSEKAELRKSSEAANTSGSKRTTLKISDEAIVQKSLVGDLPDDPEALVEARFNLKKREK